MCWLQPRQRCGLVYSLGMQCDPGPWGVQVEGCATDVEISEKGTRF